MKTATILLPAVLLLASARVLSGVQRHMGQELDQVLACNRLYNAMSDIEPDQLDAEDSRRGGGWEQDTTQLCEVLETSYFKVLMSEEYAGVCCSLAVPVMDQEEACAVLYKTMFGINEYVLDAQDVRLGFDWEENPENLCNVMEMDFKELETEEYTSVCCGE